MISKDGKDSDVGNPVSFILNQDPQISAFDPKIFESFQKIILRIAHWKKSADKIK